MRKLLFALLLPFSAMLALAEIRPQSYGFGTFVNLTGDTMTGQLTMQASTITVQGNAFSVGGSTFVVDGGRVGVLTSSPQTAFQVAGSASFGSGATVSTFTAAGALTVANNTSLRNSWDSGAVTGSMSLATLDKDFTLADSTNGTNAQAYWADVNGDYSWGAHMNLDGAGAWGYLFGAHGADSAGLVGTTSVNSSTPIYIYHNNPTLNANQNIFSIRAATRWQDGAPQGAFTGDFVEFGSSGTATAAAFRVPFDGGVVMGTSTARVGINNSSPQGYLHVGAGADAPSQGIGTTYGYFGAAGTTDLVLRDSTNDAELIFRAGSSGGTFGMTTNHALAFYTNLAARFNIQADGDAALSSSGSTAPRWIVSSPSVETIAGAATITADACGTIKKIQSTGNVTTNTTDTFTAPAAANDSCCMDILNVDTVDTITLDANAQNRFAADIAMTPCDVIRVCSDGVDWYAVSSLVANTCN